MTVLWLSWKNVLFSHLFNELQQFYICLIMGMKWAPRTHREFVREFDIGHPACCWGGGHYKSRFGSVRLQSVHLHPRGRRRSRCVVGELRPRQERRHYKSEWRRCTGGNADAYLQWVRGCLPTYETVYDASVTCEHCLLDTLTDITTLLVSNSVDWWQISPLNIS